MQILKKIIFFILTVESRLILRKYKPFIVAVTGSVGKTATKDAIFSAVSASGFVRKSDKSFNSEIGLPLTIIGVPNAWRSMTGWMSNIRSGFSLIIKRVKYPEVLILEVGADHPGDIKRVAKWLRPDISVITRVGDRPVHVEFFDSPEEVLEEKSALARAVKKGGTAVLFADEPKIVALNEALKNEGINTLTFGLSESSSVRGSDYQIIYEEIDGGRVPVGFTFLINNKSNGESAPVTIKKVIGTAFMYPILSAVVVGQLRDIPLSKIVEDVSKYDAPKGRMNIISGKNGSTLIDDTYNSSPDAVWAGLDTLKSIECSGKRLAVLGDMMELGQYSAQEHKNVGTKVPECADILVVVGPRAKAIGDTAIESGMSKDKVMFFGSSDDAGEALAGLVNKGDLVFIKGSQSVRMERVTKALMSDPSKSEQLLVRQEKEWLEKK